MSRLLLVLLLSVVLVAGAPAQERGVLPQDYYDMTFVGNVAVSPTGDMVAFVVTTVVEDKNTRHREIWLQQLERGRPAGQPFRFTDPTVESSSPRWSPDGSLLVFSSRRGDDRNSVWFARMNVPGAPFHVPGVDATPVWSPDGEWIAFTRGPREEEEERGERTPREGWIAPDAISNTLDAKRFDGRVITSMRYKRDGTLTLLPDPSIRDKSQLFIVPATGGEPRQLTDLPFNVRGAVWSPDGSTIFFSANPEEDNEYNQENTGQLYAVSVDGGEPRVLTTNPGSESSPAISPDGRSMVFSLSVNRETQTELMVVGLNSDGTFNDEPRMLTGDWDLSPRGPSWSPDGETIRFTAGIGGNSHVFEIDADGGTVRQVTAGDRRVSSVSTSQDGRVMAYTVTDAVTPAEVFVSRHDGSNETRLTSFNDEW
ncbi:MAG: PD40 domain-containing protein, partial [Gemmatimonadota bacterium]